MSTTRMVACKSARMLRHLSAPYAISLAYILNKIGASAYERVREIGSERESARARARERERERERERV